MKDPTPWSKADATAFERQLLDAAKHDRAPAALKRRMAQGLAALPLTAAATGASTTGASTTGATAQSTGASGLLFSPPVLWGSLSAILLAGALGWQQLAPKSQPATTPATRTTTASRAATPEVSAPAPQPVLELAATPQTPAPAAVAAPPTAVTAPATSAARTPQPTAARLREELALLDAARSALGARDSERALALLEQHSARYSRGSLIPEAEALRIDTYVQRGATSRAEKLSRRFLERYPTHPLAAHIATVAQ